MTQIILDHSKLIAFARVSGFLDAEAILKITAEIDDAVRSFAGCIGKHGRLFDLTDMKVAPPAAVEALSRMTIDPARAHLRANRVAYFGASPLGQLQVSRLCALRPDIAMFDDRRTAFAWATGGR